MTTAGPQPGQPVVFRNATVLTMDDAHTVFTNADVLVVGEQIAALRRIAGDEVVARIRRAPDPLIARIVAGWPRRFDPHRAIALGFTAERSFDEIIRVYIEDELGGGIAQPRSS